MDRRLTRWAMGAGRPLRSVDDMLIFAIILIDAAFALLFMELNI